MTKKRDQQKSDGVKRDNLTHLTVPEKYLFLVVIDKFLILGIATKNSSL
jgi:hypothetical protein